MKARNRALRPKIWEASFDGSKLEETSTVLALLAVVSVETQVTWLSWPTTASESMSAALDRAYDTAFGIVERLQVSIREAMGFVNFQELLQKFRLTEPWMRRRG